MNPFNAVTTYMRVERPVFSDFLKCGCIEYVGYIAWCVVSVWIEFMGICMCGLFTTYYLIVFIS